MRDYQDDPTALHRDMPHRTGTDFIPVARRLGWLTWEDFNDILPAPVHGFHGRPLSTSATTTIAPAFWAKLDRLQQAIAHAVPQLMPGSNRPARAACAARLCLEGFVGHRSADGADLQAGYRGR
jgi:hypothetical protein